MKIPDSTDETSLQDSNPLYILITILEHDTMPFWQNDRCSSRSHSGSRNSEGSFQGNHDAPRSQQNPPCRRSMAIHDMLNPLEGENPNYRRYQSAQAESDEDRQMSTSPTPPGSSGRQSPTQSNTGRRRMSYLPPRSPPTRAPRQFRPPYSDEEVHFIWYHRIDLGYEWSDITRAYNAQFPQRQREGFGGIQCKYYRLRDAYNIPKVRLRDRSSSPAEAYGMRSTTGLSYPWMKE